MIRLNFLLWAFLGVYLLRSVTQYLLTRLNISHVRKHGFTAPVPFRDLIDQEKLKQIAAYTIDSENFGIFETLLSQGLFLIILLSGVFPWLVKIIDSWEVSLILAGLIFFALLAIAGSLLRIPLSLYETFVIEGRHGFNVMTLRMWIIDLLKTMIMSAILGGLLLVLLSFLVIYGGRVWWIWAWGVTGAFELLMLWLFPVVIAPLFNKFEPIQNKTLEDRIGTLMGKAGLRVKGVFQMDAGKRSKHTNAFFTGVGRTKRIVLFDTLLASHTEEEILAVLAHEVGHWKKKHVLKQIALLEILSLAVFFIAAELLDWQLLYQTFGFQRPTFYIGLFLIAALIGPLGYFVQPVESAIVRRLEIEADDYSLELMQGGKPMRHALKRLACDNLANLTPHPLYAWFYYSHPPLAERISRLEREEKRRLFAASDERG